MKKKLCGGENTLANSLVLLSVFIQIVPLLQVWEKAMSLSLSKHQDSMTSFPLKQNKSKKPKTKNLKSSFLQFLPFVAS